MTSRYKQTGKNVLYPKEIETWRLGEELPEWLLNICKVEYDKETDGFKPVIQPGVKGGYVLLESGNTAKVLVCATKDSDYIAKDTKSYRLYVISERGLELMYSEQKKKRSK